jgi:transcriptional regulator with XRE-family HTH domain
MTIDGPSDVPPFCALEATGHSWEGGSPLRPRERQNVKIGEIKNVLTAAGVITLDKQAEALGLSRSTAWHLLNGKHKGSGISATVINRMLAAPRLPPAVRITIFEYIAEKVAGRYGDTKLRLSKFTARIPSGALDHARAIGGNRRNRPAPLRFSNPRPAMPRNRIASR